jgi:hypothetical protein
MSITSDFHVVWLAVMALAALIVAGTSGILAWLGGAKVPTAVIAGAGAFGGTLALFLLIAGFLAGGP